MKNEDVNWVRKNPRPAKYDSLEMGDTLRGSSTAILQLAAWKLYGIRADFSRNSLDFVKFPVTCTVKCENAQVQFYA